MQNPAFQNAHDPYYTQEKRFLLHLVPDGPNVVLDLGCGAGGVGKALLDLGKARELIGVEIFEPAARAAMNYYRDVHVGDLERMDLPYRKFFDVVLCGDILEHLQDPASLVRRIHGWLKDDGLIVCCVPNIRYYPIWRDLIFKGQWEYQSHGIMDQTHLRFFTTRSFEKLLTGASFQIQDRCMRIPGGPGQRLFHRLTRGAFQDFFATQMLYSARKT